MKSIRISFFPRAAKATIEMKQTLSFVTYVMNKRGHETFMASLGDCQADIYKVR